MGTHVHLWLIHVNVWQKPLEYFKVISLQLNFKKKVKSLSRVQLFGTPWTIVHQAPLGKNTGVGCYFLLQGIFPTQGFEPRSPTLQADALTSEPPRKPHSKYSPSIIFFHLLLIIVKYIYICCTSHIMADSFCISEFSHCQMTNSQ